MVKEKKCIVLFSGGLDSRLAIKIMEEQGYSVLALNFKLPFGEGCCNSGCSFNFSQMEGVDFKMVDCTKGKFLQEYLDVVKEAKNGIGSGVNPCIDCRIFLFVKAKQIADEMGIDLLVTGEVLGERPMSQMTKSIKVIEESCGLQGRLLRPLSAKFFPETNAEKEGLVNREKLYSIQGRQRKIQMEIAKKFGISYPNPGGGCLLCEKTLINRLSKLIKRGVNDDEIKFVKVGRHFIINYCWVVIGRNSKENKTIEFFKKKYDVVLPNSLGPSAIIFNKANRGVKKIVGEIIKAYSKEGSLDDRKKFEKYLL